MGNNRHWKAKVFAFVHDPGEKALILLRGKGHEQGTVSHLRKILKEDPTGPDEELDVLVKIADHWASAADRPSLPKGRGGRVNFAADPQLVHALTGKKFRIKSLEADIPAEAGEAVSFDHFEKLIVREGQEVDWKKTFLALWRFGPTSPAANLGVLWGQLPADTRSPDHTIWEHLSLTSAFAGAMAADKDGLPALLLMSLGPVQGFISQARSVSDLWAGSHLLSYMAWEAMKVVCEAYGPDAVLFPSLHGVALVDLWIKECLGDWKEDKTPLWKTKETDANPLFAAALPNRFVALVPASNAKALANQAQERVRLWVKDRAKDALDELLRVGGLKPSDQAEAQLKRQFADFPEVHWAVIPWNLAGKQELRDEPLKKVLEDLSADPIYLGQDLDRLLRNRLNLDAVEFYTPNPGVAYPGMYEALERIHASTKSVRVFSGHAEEGYRCSLCGEREWLAVERGDPEKRTGIYSLPGQRSQTLWTAVAEHRSSIAKEGEHLCGWCAVKRLWPRLFAEMAAEAAGMERKPDRFVLSTHTVAVSTSLWRWVEKKAATRILDPEESKALSALREELVRLCDQSEEIRSMALPAKLHSKLRKTYGDDGTMQFFKELPSYLDAVGDERKREQAVRSFEKCFGTKPETYYGLVLMDGDRMGAWLSGGIDRPLLESRFHDTTLEDLKSCGQLEAYLAAQRPVSPAWHQAISTALNGFALHLSRVVVEELFMGKLIYAGGDDLLAMVAVHDLPQLMFALRCVFSGQIPAEEDHTSFWRKLGADPERIRTGSGFALVKEGGESRLLRLMGEKATASVGAIIAHHQAPLGRVLSELRRAEGRAKTEGGRDAFCITVCKRSGGTSHLIGKWNLDHSWAEGDMGLLLDLRDVLARDVSRRVAYELSEVFRHIPPHAEALTAVMDYQFRRKAKEEGGNASRLAEHLARRAVSEGRTGAHSKDGWPLPNLWLRSMVLTAEFLAREGRVAEDFPKQRGE